MYVHAHEEKEIERERERERDSERQRERERDRDPRSRAKMKYFERWPLALAIELKTQQPLQNSLWAWRFQSQKKGFWSLSVPGPKNSNGQ